MGRIRPEGCQLYIQTVAPFLQTTVTKVPIVRVNRIPPNIASDRKRAKIIWRNDADNLNIFLFAGIAKFTLVAT